LIRQNILGQPTPRQSQVAISAATADLDNNQTDEVESIQRTNILNDNTGKHDIKFENKIIVHYTHEKRFRSFKRDMHHIYGNTFQNKIDKDIKMIVGNRNRRDAQKELIRKRPKQSLLKNKTLKSKFPIAIHVPKIKSTNVFFFIFFSHIERKRKTQNETSN
jgi:hypothetical protein